MSKIFLYIFVMALVTYLVRMIPFVLMRKSITSPFLQSFLHYIPYTVLAAMTIPGIFYSTGSSAVDLVAAGVGFLTAIILALMKRSLLVVSLCASAAVYLAHFLLAHFI